MRIITAFMLVIVASASSAQEPIKRLEKIESPVEAADEAVTRERVDELVEGLGSRTFKAREEASAALKKLGRGALPHLERHRDHADAETRVRVRTLIAELSRPVEEKTLDLPEDEELFEGLDPRRPRGLELEPRGFRDIWRDLDRIFEERGMNSRLGRPGDLFERHRSLMDRMERDFDGLSRGGMTLRLGPGGGASFSSSSSLTFDGARLTWSTTSEGVRLDVHRDGAEDSFSAPDLESFIAQHPEIYEQYKDSGIFERTTFSFDVPGLGTDPTSQPRFRARGGFIDELERLFGGLSGRDPFIEPTPRFQPMPQVAPDAPRLGVIVSGLTSEEAAGLAVTDVDARGVKITQVLPGSAAASMGLAVGDILLSFNGAPLNMVTDLVEGVQRAGAGGSVHMKLVREGVLLSMEGALPGTRRAAPNGRQRNQRDAPQRIERDARPPRPRRARKL